MPGARSSVVGADAGWRFETAPDASAEVARTAPADVVLVFVRAAAELESALVEHEQRVFPAGALWIAWPRAAAGHVSDLSDILIRDAALARHLVDVKVAALDHDWSALKLVWRVQYRE